MQPINTVLVHDCVGIKSTVFKILDDLGADSVFKKQEKILLKPNLVIRASHPVTTSPGFVEAVLLYVQKVSDARIVIAEGSGDPNRSTHEIFRALGYDSLSKKYGVDLFDLNVLAPKKFENPDRHHLKKIYLPEMAFSHYIVSLPVLKAHSLATITGSLKNMMGFAPPSHYGGSWNKSAFHARMQDSIIDLNRYRCPDLAIMDATVGLADYHLGGNECNPAREKIIAGFDAKKVDRRAADLLDLDWTKIRHLQ